MRQNQTQNMGTIVSQIGNAKSTNIPPEIGELLVEAHRSHAIEFHNLVNVGHYLFGDLLIRVEVWTKQTDATESVQESIKPLTLIPPDVREDIYLER